MRGAATGGAPPGLTVRASCRAETDPVVVRARQSFAIGREDAAGCLGAAEDYDAVLAACAKNVKVPRLPAASRRPRAHGVARGRWARSPPRAGWSCRSTSTPRPSELPHRRGRGVRGLAHAAASFFDKDNSPAIARALLDVLQAKLRSRALAQPAHGERTLVVGMEMAGGCMVAQFAALAASTHPELLELADFVCVDRIGARAPATLTRAAGTAARCGRRAGAIARALIPGAQRRKGSGTMQQLEGPGFITSRTPDSPVRPLPPRAPSRPTQAAARHRGVD